jgi:hypothetical protein
MTIGCASWNAAFCLEVKSRVDGPNLDGAVSGTAVPRETEISPRFEPLDVTDEERWAAVVPVLPV